MVNVNINKQTNLISESVVINEHVEDLGVVNVQQHSGHLTSQVGVYRLGKWRLVENEIYLFEKVKRGNLNWTKGNMRFVEEKSDTNIC